MGVRSIVCEGLGISCLLDFIRSVCLIDIAAVFVSMFAVDTSAVFVDFLGSHGDHTCSVSCGSNNSQTCSLVRKLMYGGPKSTLGSGSCC